MKDINDISDGSMRRIRLEGLFSRNISDKNKQFVFDTYHNEEWDELITHFYCRRKFGHRKVISNDAVYLCRKAQEELDIFMFPVVERITYPYKSSGEWSWTMRTNDGYPYEYGSSEPIRGFKGKNKTLALGRDEEIFWEWANRKGGPVLIKKRGKKQQN